MAFFMQKQEKSKKLVISHEVLAYGLGYIFKGPDHKLKVHNSQSPVRFSLKKSRPDPETEMNLKDREMDVKDRILPALEVVMFAKYYIRHR